MVDVGAVLTVVDVVGVVEVVTVVAGITFNVVVIDLGTTCTVDGNATTSATYPGFDKLRISGAGSPAFGPSEAIGAGSGKSTLFKSSASGVSTTVDVPSAETSLDWTTP